MSKITRFFSLLTLASLAFSTPTLASESSNSFFIEEEAPQVVLAPNECYTLQERLGAGAFGEVFKATDSQGNTYAIKSYHSQGKDWGGAMGLLADVEREFRVGQELDHPNIVKVVDLFSVPSEEGETYYLVLEYIEGDTVYHLEKKSLGFDQAVLASLELVDALRYGVEHGRAHVDLHSNNVMIDKDGHLMVIDVSSFFTAREYIHGLELASESSTTEESSETEDTETVHAVQRLFEREAKAFEQQSDKAQKSLSSNSVNAKTMPWYFSRVVRMCNMVLRKSGASREKKVRLQTQIAGVSLEYDFDVDEELEPNLIDYLNRIEEVLLNELELSEAA